MLENTRPSGSIAQIELGFVERAFTPKAAMGGFSIFESLVMLSGFLIGGTITEAYGYLAALLVAGGHEIVIGILATRTVYHITTTEAAPSSSSA